MREAKGQELFAEFDGFGTGGQPVCRLCGKPIESEKSVARGYGCDCWSKIRRELRRAQEQEMSGLVPKQKCFPFSGEEG
jgi:hypothetical protein